MNYLRENLRITFKSPKFIKKQHHLYKLWVLKFCRKTRQNCFKRISTFALKLPLRYLQSMSPLFFAFSFHNTNWSNLDSWKSHIVWYYHFMDILFTVHCHLLLIRLWSLWMFSCLWHNWWLRLSWVWYRHWCRRVFRTRYGWMSLELSIPVNKATTTSPFVDISFTTCPCNSVIRAFFHPFPDVLPYILIIYWCVVSDNLEDDKWTTINCSLWGTIIFINEFNIC